MQLGFMLDIGLKVLNKLKEMPFGKNYLNYFSVVLSPRTITFGGEKCIWRPLSASRYYLRWQSKKRKEIEKLQICKKHGLQM